MTLFSGGSHLSRWTARLVMVLLFLASVPSWSTGAAPASLIADENLASAIRENLRLPAGTALTVQDLGRLRDLDVSGRGIRSLEGLEYATALTVLIADRNLLTDLRPLAGLTNLRNLGLGGNQIREIEPLAGLTGLEVLTIWENQVEDLTPITGMVRLRKLLFQGNRVRDLTPLRTLAENGGLPEGAEVWPGHNDYTLTPDSPAAAVFRLLLNRGVKLKSGSEAEEGGYSAYQEDAYVPESAPGGSGEAPAATSRPTMVRNAEDGSYLLFGGHSGGDIINQLFRYWPETGRWERVDPASGPSPVRGAHAAVWDTVRKEMIVLFGVNDLEEDTNEVWVYTPATNRWRQVEPAGTERPSARKDTPAVWDPVRKQVLAFGGHAVPKEPDGPAVTDELWAWRPAENRWVQLRPEGQGPSRRHGHAAAWDPVGQRLLIFGGSDFIGDERFNDLWAYDPKSNRWTQLQGNEPRGGEGRPSGRERMRMVWDTAANRLLLYGGCCGPAVVMNDLWSWDPKTGRWQWIARQGERPSARELYASLWDPDRQEMVMFGGWGHCWPHGDAWAYRPAENRWRRLDAPPSGGLPTLQGQTAVWDEKGDQMLIFGGCDNARARSDVWAYRPAENSLTRLAVTGEPPLARNMHQAAWDPVRRRMLVFGGYGNMQTLNDLWAFYPDTGRWERLEPAGGWSGIGDRYNGAAVWDPVREQMIVLGGRDRNAIPATVLAYQAKSGGWKVLGDAGTGPRDWQRAVWDSTGSRVLAFAGWTVDELGLGRWPAKHFFYDIWSFQPGSGAWAELKDASVPLDPQGVARYGEGAFSGRFHRLPSGATVAWDSAQKQFLSMGGHMHEFGADGQARSAFTDQLWSFKPTTNRWTRIAPAGETPPGRIRSSSVWDRKRQVMYVYGGMNSELGVLNDLWAYDSGANRWTRLTPTVVDQAAEAAARAEAEAKARAEAEAKARAEAEAKARGARSIRLGVDSASASLDGAAVQLETAPYSRNDRTMVPVRFIAEALGLDVKWEATTRTAILTGNSATEPLTVIITVGLTTATVNGRPVNLDVPAEITGGRTFLPLRFVAESFGLKVEYDAETRTIRLSR